MAKSFGLAVEVIGPAEIKARYPLLEVGDAVGGVFLPKDGQANPIDTTQAFAKGARQRGARIVEGVKVERILVEQGRAVGVMTEQGPVAASTVVLAAGMWSRELAAAVGVSVPLHAAEHFYIVTEPLADVPRDLPVLRVTDECTYYKEDAGKLLVGAFEPVAKPWGMGGIPESFCFDSLPEDMDHFEPILEKATARLPILATAGIQTFFNGPESFTPDDRYLLGETAELRDLFVATGFNSIGIQSSGGAGKVLAEWIRDRRMPVDLTDVDVRRLHPFQSNRTYLRDRTTETLGLLYAMHWPYRQYATARGVRRSPFHDRLVAAGAVMGETAGWERPNWYAPAGVEPEYRYSWGRQNWFEHTAAECRAVRDAVALFDQSSFAKFLVEGRDACAVLNRLSVADMDVPAGRIVYTQWCNEQGGIEADLTVTRLGETSFLVVTGAAVQTRDLAWLREHIPAEARCSVVDITSGLPMLGLMGPRSRALLERLSGEDLSNAAFPFGTSRELEIGYARVRASRITYVGELGWELYVPGRVRDPRVRPHRRGRPGVRPDHGRLPRHERLPHREGLPPLGPRHRPRGRPARGRPRLLRRLGQAGRVHRPRGAAAGPGCGDADAAAGSVAPAGRQQAALSRGARLGGWADRGVGDVGHVRPSDRSLGRHGLSAACRRCEP